MANSKIGRLGDERWRDLCKSMATALPVEDARAIIGHVEAAALQEAIGRAAHARWLIHYDVFRRVLRDHWFDAAGGACACGTPDVRRLTGIEILRDEWIAHVLRELDVIASGPAPDVDPEYEAFMADYPVLQRDSPIYGQQFDGATAIR